ncbi:MAG: hypothetical protein ABI190_10870 [Casimicrobiaceae bacterium]
MRSSRARRPRKLDPYEYERLAQQIASIDGVTLDVARRQVDRFLRDCPLDSASRNTLSNSATDVGDCAAPAPNTATRAQTGSCSNL